MGVRISVIGSIKGVLVLLCATGAFVAHGESAQDPFTYNPHAFSLEGGTTGFGGAAIWRFASHFGIRGGIDYFSLSQDATIEGIPYQASLRLMSEFVAVNVYPFRKSTFHVSAGALFNQNELTGNSGDDFTLGGFPSSEVGSLHLKCEQQPLNPYVSLGCSLYFDKEKHWSMGVEAGVIYTGNPKVTLTRSGGISDPAIDDALEQERQRIEDIVRNYRFWPVVKLAVSYSF